MVVLREDISEQHLLAGKIYQVIEVFAPDEFAVKLGGIHLHLNQVAVLRHEATIDEEVFWKLMEETKTESGNHGERQVQLLVERLATMSVADIFAYGEIFDHFQNMAYQRELWTAATILSDGGDDGFVDFRAWLIAQGKQIFYDALRDPDTLADIVDPGSYGDVELEQMNYVEFYAYENKMGEEMPLFSYMEPRSKLAGDWLDDVVCAKFPKLMRKFRPEQCNRGSE